MTVLYLRTFFVVVSSIAGYYVGGILGNFNMAWQVGGAACAFAGSTAIILIEIMMRRFSIMNLSAAVFGLIFGFFMAWILTGVLKLIPMSIELFSSLQIMLILVFCYLCMVIAMR